MMSNEAKIKELEEKLELTTKDNNQNYNVRGSYASKIHQLEEKCLQLKIAVGKATDIIAEERKKLQVCKEALNIIQIENREDRTEEMKEVAKKALLQVKGN